MSDALLEPISVLCDEIGLKVPSPSFEGVYVLKIDDQEIRVSSLTNGKVILLGIVGKVADIAERRKESIQMLLASCLNVQAVRFGKLGTSEVLTFEPETEELVIWQPLDGVGVSIPVFLHATESLLNELEFWKNWLAIS